MSVTAVVCSVQVLAASLTLPVTFVLAMNDSPNTKDAWAVLGAMLATVIAIAEARKRDRSLGNLISVIIAASGSGSLFPGLAAHVWLSEEAKSRLPWQAWAASGWILGMVGWVIVLAFVHWLSRRGSAITEAALDHYTNDIFPGGKP